MEGRGSGGCDAVREREDPAVVREWEERVYVLRFGENKGTKLCR